jgi:hypothetical protein
VPDLLPTYLNDHLAGATAGVELARRAAASNRGSSYGRALTQLAEEIAEDRQTLEQVMDCVGARRDRAKVMAAWSAEKLGRLKLNGQLLGYSPLSRLEELEALALGAQGKLLLWQALAHTHGDDARLREFDLAALQQRARSQQQRLNRHRREAAGEALR